LANLFCSGEFGEFSLSISAEIPLKALKNRVRQRYLLVWENPTAKQSRIWAVFNELADLLAMPHGVRGRSFPQVLFAMAFAISISYCGLSFPQSPISDGTSPKRARNAEIRARRQKGETIAALAEVFGITEQRIWQILNDRRK
jgi:hypothetical protein